MPDKLSEEESIARMTKKHNGKYDYSKFKYANNHTKSEVICRKHGSFFITYHQHVDRGTGCRQCYDEYCIANKFTYTTETIRLRFEEIYGKDKFDYSEMNYINIKTEIKIKCKTCSTCFNILPGAHAKGTTVCPNKCYDKRKHTNESAKTILKEIHGEKLCFDSMNYKNNTTNIDVKCLVCNRIFKSTFNRLTKPGNKGCIFCFRDEKCYTKENLIEELEKIHGDKYNYDYIKNYKSTRDYIDIFCNKCNRIFSQRASSHLDGTNCSHCWVESISGENNYAWNPNREKIEIYRQISSRIRNLLRCTKKISYLN